MAESNPGGEQQDQRRRTKIPPPLAGVNAGGPAGGFSGAGSGWSAAGGGPGTGGLSALLRRSGFAHLRAVLSSPPAVVATLTAAATISAIGLKDMHSRGVEDVRAAVERSIGAPSGRRQFAPALLEGLPGGGAAGSSSLALAGRANKGAFGGESTGVAETAEEEWSHEDAEVLGEDLEGRELPGPEDGVAEVADAAAAKRAAAEKSSGKRPGRLTARLRRSPGTLASGGGMAGGIGRGFDMPLSNKQLRKAQALRSGRKVSVTRGKTAVRSRGKSGLRGATAKRLAGMSSAMGAGQAQNPETGAAVHSQQWEASGQKGGSLQGAGAAGDGISGQGEAVGGAGSGEGGPILQPSSAGSASGGGSSAPPVGEGKNVTPWQGLIDMVMILLPIAGLLLMGAYILGRMKKYMIAKWLAYAALAVSAMVTALGVAILAHGQMLQGGLIAGVGAMLAFLSYTAAEGNKKAANAELEAKTLAEQEAAKSPMRPFNQREQMIFDQEEVMGPFTEKEMAIQAEGAAQAPPKPPLNDRLRDRTKTTDYA
ncbi:MAG: hypothetical protein ABII00_03475 [Elusimicrobiota bacterium]